MHICSSFCFSPPLKKKIQKIDFFHIWGFLQFNVEQIDFSISNMTHQQPPSNYLHYFQIIYKPIKILTLPTFYGEQLSHFNQGKNYYTELYSNYHNITLIP